MRLKLFSVPHTDSSPGSDHINVERAECVVYRLPPWFTCTASAVRTNKSYSRVRRDFLNETAVTEIASAKENASCYSENVLLLLWRRRRVVKTSGGDGACDFIDVVVVVARRVSPRGH